MTRTLCRLLAGNVYAWVSVVCMYKKRLFSEKRREGQCDLHESGWCIFSLPTPSPVSRVIYYIGGWESRALQLPPLSYILTAYPCRVSHWQILADWSVAKRSGSPQFMPGEESLDSKCILGRWCGEAGTEGHKVSSKLGTPLSHGKGDEMVAQLLLTVTPVLCAYYLQSTSAFLNRLSSSRGWQGSSRPSQESARRPACASVHHRKSSPRFYLSWLIIWKTVHCTKWYQYPNSTFPMFPP